MTPLSKKHAIPRCQRASWAGLAKLALGVGLGWVASTHGLAQGPLHVDERRDTTTPENHLVFKLSGQSLFSNYPAGGFATMVTRTENFTNKPTVLRMRCSTGTGNAAFMQTDEWTAAEGKKTLNYSYPQTLPNLSEGKATSHHYGGGYRGYSNVGLKVEAGGCEVQFNTQVSQEPVAALSTALTDSSPDKFQSTTSGHGTRLLVGGFVASLLPADWRAYHGFSVVAMTAQEWLDLTSAVRESIAQYVRMGGELAIMSTSAETWDRLQMPCAAPGALGFGQIYTRMTSKLPLSVSEVESMLGKVKNTKATDRFNNEAANDSSWQLLVDALGNKAYGSALVGLVLLGFAVVVGPVNLFYLAPKGRRHRLFVTTPIISIAASLLLGGAILLQDGVGGVGIRTGVVYLDAVSNTATVHQREVNRTGLLLGGGFKLAEKSYISPVVLADLNRWTRLKSDYSHYYRRSNHGTQTYLLNNGKECSGDFYQSRSLQGLGTEFIRSTRGKLELVGTNEAPVLRSSLESTLAYVYVRWGNQTWSASEIATGQSVPLRKIGTVLPQLKERSLLHDYDSALDAAMSTEGSFLGYAKGEACRPFLQDNLASVKWSKEELVIGGKLVIDSSLASAAKASATAPEAAVK